MTHIFGKATPTPQITVQPPPPVDLPQAPTNTGPPTPPPAPTPIESPPLPDITSPGVLAAQRAAMARQLAMGGRQATILTNSGNRPGAKLGA